jgi:transposase
MNYSGIDLHSNNSVVVITDEQDRMVAEKRLPNEFKKIIEFLEPWREGLAGVVVESTYNWYWLVDGLQEAGFEIKLANTWAIKPYEGLKHSGDKTDARHLAHLLRLAILPTGSILPPEQRALRDLAWKRMQLVRSRTSYLLAIQNTIARQQGIAIGSDPIKRLTQERIGQMGLSGDVALAIESNLAVIVTLGAQIDRLEKRLQERMEARPEYDLLTSVPGIGSILATVTPWKPVSSTASPRSDTLLPMRAVSTASGSATARRKAREMSRMVTNTWSGPLSRRPTSPCASVPKPSASTNARRPKRTPR